MRRLAPLTTLTLALLVFASATPHGQRRPTLSTDLLTHRIGAHLHRVIVQGDGGTLLSLRSRGLGIFRGRVTEGIVMELTDAQLDAVSRDSGVSHISGDLPVHADAAITNDVTGATTIWQGTSGLLGIGGTPGYQGASVTVAVLDSGIASHAALGTRVIAHVNLVSTEPGVTGDPFGHGTHVAGIVGGNGAAASKVTTEYNGGSAPAVKLVDVRVLGRDGSGLTSDVIAGIDWTIANRSKYKIRVINLSLGHPVTEPSTTDPLCLAVARAVDAGLVVVVSAGNYGVAASGAPELGGITSPGNSPFAITVGATDTVSTLSTSDDVVAPYSSRGPARYEMTVKPDVVAPGTRIVSLEAQGSYLSKTYPQWHIAGSGTNAYLRLSGTSMATAVVSGGVALILDEYPSLVPAQTKIALQMGARFMPHAGLIAAGAGQVYFPASMKVAQTGLVPSLLTTVTSLLGSSSGAAFRDTGSMIDRVYDRSGIRLLSILDLSGLFQNADDAEWGVLQLLGLSNPLGGTPANWLVWGDVAGWSSSYYVVWGNTIQSPSGEYVVWGNGDTSDSNYVVWGNALPGGN